MQSLSWPLVCSNWLDTCKLAELFQCCAKAMHFWKSHSKELGYLCDQSYSEQQSEYWQRVRNASACVTCSFWQKTWLSAPPPPPKSLQLYWIPPDQARVTDLMLIRSVFLEAKHKNGKGKKIMDVSLENSLHFHGNV